MECTIVHMCSCMQGRYCGFYSYDICSIQRSHFLRFGHDGPRWGERGVAGRRSLFADSITVHSTCTLLAT